MNFVIFSYSFLPQSGAESYCSTRFASALADAGHRVHVVTMDWPQQVSKEVGEFLLSKRITVTRVPRDCKGGKSTWARFRYLTYERYASEIPEAVKTVKRVLKEEGSAILITRSFPWFSFIVGWECRRVALKWIAHLSDPIPPPWEGTETFTFKLRRIFAMIWMRRLFKNADYISVTCETAKRFFKELLGDLCDESKIMVVTHIGEPSLPEHCMAKNVQICRDKNMILHTGSLYGGRGVKEMVNAVQKLNEEGIPCVFVQCGDVDRNMLTWLKSEKNVVLVDGDDLAKVIAYRKVASVEFVPDVMTPLPYVPFLPSKFVYQVFTDKPLVVFTKQDGMLSRYCNMYKNSGIFFADSSDAISLVLALKKALSTHQLEFDRSGIRDAFSREKVISEFIARLRKDNIDV